LKIILSLVAKDFRRDWKRPWSVLLFSAMPLMMTALMAAVFGGQGASKSLPTLHVAVLDQDKDMLSGVLRSMPSQGDAAKQLRLHFVDNREEGVRLLEKRQASAFAILHAKMTEGLLDGLTNSIEFYENPAEQILPKVARQGVSLLAAGLSGAAEILREPLKDIRELVRKDEFPADIAVIGAATQSLQKLRNMKTYLFPPLIQFRTVAAADWSYETANPPDSAQKP
jgi:hypothetical protein